MDESPYIRHCCLCGRHDGHFTGIFGDADKVGGFYGAYSIFTAGTGSDHDPRWNTLFGDYGRTSKTAQEISQGCSGKRRESPNVSTGADQQHACGPCLWSRKYSGGTGGRYDGAS